MQYKKKSQQFKKEALQFILSIYLKRQNDQDIKFIQQNVRTTAQFSKNVSSSIKYGLSQDDIQKNKLMYGKNSKRYIKTFCIKEIILRVIKLHNVLITCICLIQVIFGTILKNRQIYMDAIYAFMLLCSVLLIRIFTIYHNQKKKSQQSYEKNKNQKYRVFRQGNFIQIPQTKIVVGDIVELDYKQKIPACGILISNQQISINEEIYGKKIQRKMCIEKSISYIKKLSHLQLKIDAETLSLPSPILLRGTEQIFGSSYRMLVIAVDQETLLEKHLIPDDSTFVSDVIRDWFEKLEIKIQKIMRIISIIYLILFLFVFGLKQFLQRRHLSPQMFFTDLFSVLLMSILGFSVFDTNCLRLFFQTQVISYTQNLNNPKQVDKYLTVEQIYITEDNIVKYDQIKVCQLAIPDKQNIVKFQDINILSNSIKSKIEEVLIGVGLMKKNKGKGRQNIFSGSQLPQDIKQNYENAGNDNKMSQIIHINTVDQKIFSSLYARIQKTQQNQQDLETPMFINLNNQENASNISLHRITPLEQDQPFALKQTKNKFRRKQLSTLSKKSQNTANQDSLKGYLGQFCKFKTQNIVQSIVQLAKQESKTYYYQKYSLSRLKKIPYIYLNSTQLQMNKQRIEKTKRLARTLRVNENLTPFLIGYSDGAYNNTSMNVLVCVIGVHINYQNQIIQRLKQLSSLGINSSVLIHKRDEEDKDQYTKENFLLQSKVTTDFHQEQEHNKTILSEYINRGWIFHQAQQMIDFSTLRQSGGMIRCQNCFLSKCDCKDRQQSLSNIQGFMSSCQNTKIIYSIQNQNDIHYLKVGSEQLRHSVLLITKYKADTVKILEDIKKGFYLSNVLEKGLNVWYGFMFVSATCFYPLALVSFGGVFCSGDLSLWILFIQSLPVIGNLDIQIQQSQKVENQTRRSKVLFSKKSTVSVFLLCLISTIGACMIYIQPQFIVNDSFGNIAEDLKTKANLVLQRDCTYKFSIFLSNQYSPLQCNPEPQSYSHNLDKIPQYVYSQNVNFIFSYLCLNMFFFLMINFKNFTKLKFLFVYLSFFGVYFYVIYVQADLIHGRYDGLTPGQLGIVFSMSILTNLLIQLICYVSNYSCSVCDTEEFQSILSFEQNIQDHYSTKLKKYNTFETEIYTLN